MKIGIIGSGNMGRSLGLLWAEIGHEVFFGARSLEKAQKVAALSKGNVHAGTNAEAAAFGDVLLYTARGVHPAEVAGSSELFSGKIVIDCNNSDVPADFIFPPVTFSLAEQLQEQIPEAKVIKAFNNIPMEVFELAPNNLQQYKVADFIAGDDAKARGVVRELSKALGFDAIDTGDLVRARFLEAQADFLRYMLIQGIRPDGSFSIVDTPDAPISRLGGREATTLGELK